MHWNIHTTDARVLLHVSVLHGCHHQGVITVVEVVLSKWSLHPSKRNVFMVLRLATAVSTSEHGFGVPIPKYFSPISFITPEIRFFVLHYALCS
jgi:hypothetical protein